MEIWQLEVLEPRRQLHKLKKVKPFMCVKHSKEQSQCHEFIFMVRVYTLIKYRCNRLMGNCSFPPIVSCCCWFALFLSEAFSDLWLWVASKIEWPEELKFCMASMTLTRDSIMSINWKRKKKVPLSTANFLSHWLRFGFEWKCFMKAPILLSALKAGQN